MPIAIVIGAAPVVMFTGAQKLATDVDEIGVAGALAGRGVPIARCATIDLDVPADSEIVIEGLIDTDKLEPEAPFGESNGYVALEAFNMPMQVTAITHRRHPVFASIISQVTPSESSLVKKVAYEPLYPGASARYAVGARRAPRRPARAAHQSAAGASSCSSRPARARTEVWRGSTALSPLRSNLRQDRRSRSARISIRPIVDAVLWSIAYRCNPIDDVQIVPYHGGDRARNIRAADAVQFQLLIDATRKRPMPPLALPTTRIHGARARAVGEARPASADRAQPRPGTAIRSATGSSAGRPIAERATAGDWENTGQETLARQRGDMMPEESVRKGEE